MIYALLSIIILVLGFVLFIKNVELNTVKKENERLLIENVKVVGDNKKITLEYIAIKDMWTKLERQASEMLMSMGRPSTELDFSDMFNKPKESKKVKYDVDDILNEINQKGISNIEKEKLDFLKQFNK